MKGRQADKVFFSKIQAVEEITKFEAFMVWNGDSSFPRKHTGSTIVGLADTKGEFKIISTSLGFQPGSALSLLLRVSK